MDTRSHGRAVGPSPAAPSRRAILAGAVGLCALALAGPAAAAGANKGPARHFRLPPMTIQGKDRFSYVRLEAELVVRETDKLASEMERVNLLRPRIVGQLIENLSAERFEDTLVTTEQVKWLKGRIRELSNAAIGEPLIEDVLIISLLVT